MPPVAADWLRGFSARSGLDLPDLCNPLAPTQVVTANPLPSKPPAATGYVRVHPLVPEEELDFESTDDDDLFTRTILGVAMIAIIVGVIGGLMASLSS